MSWPISIIGSGRSSASRRARLTASLIVNVVVAGTAVVVAIVALVSIPGTYHRTPGTPSSIARADATTATPAPDGALMRGRVGAGGYSLHGILGFDGGP